MQYDEAKKYNACQIQDMGYDVGEACRNCINDYGVPACADTDGDCGMLDDLHQMLVKEGETND